MDLREIKQKTLETLQILLSKIILQKQLFGGDHNFEGFF